MYYKQEACTMDVFGNEYVMISDFITMDSNTIFPSFAILLYFNIKYYVIYMLMRKNTKYSNSERRLKLGATTIINLLHILFYFFQSENIISIDGCGIMRMLFMLVQMFSK